MRLRSLLLASVLLVLIALATSACGGGNASPHDAYAKQLDSACDDMRTKIEALGLPSDEPISKIYPGTVKIGKAFVKRITLFEPPAEEKANAALFIKQFGYYFDGLALGYAVLTKRENQQGFIQTVGGAEANLKLAEGYARKLGAKACTRRPFT
jgi:hypothetical protein